MNRHSWIATTAVAVIALAGCGATDGEPTIADESTITTESTMTEDASSEQGEALMESEALIGSSWTLRFGAGPEGEVALVDGWPISLTFDGDTLGGTAACNGYGGSYSIVDSTFQLEDVGQNQQGCLPEVQESERAYLAALLDVDGIDWRGDELALSGPSSELIFARNEPVQLDNLVATRWLLEATIQDDTSNPVQGNPATLLLETDGTVIADTGCRSLSGSYLVSGNEVVLTEFAADGDCPTALFDQDSKVVSVLGDGFTTEIDGDTLVLTSSGNEGLRYRAVGEDELSTLSGTEVPSDADLLSGVEWTFAGGDGPDGPIVDPRTIDPSAIITLVLLGDSYEGEAFCNSYGGAADVGNGRLTLEVPSAEEEGCGAALDDLATTYFDALPLMTEFGLEANDERLVANGNDTELWFERSE